MSRASLVRSLAALLVVLLGASTALADQFYFVRSISTTTIQETGLFVWDDVAGTQTQVGGTGAVYTRHATDGNMNVDAIAMTPAGVLYGFALDDVTNATPLPITSASTCTANMRSRLVTVDTTTAIITYVGPWLTGRHVAGAGVDGQGRLWAVDCASQQVMPIDLATGTVVGTPIALGVNTTASADIDFAANGLGIVGYESMNFRVFNPTTGWVSTVPLTVTNSGFDPGPPPTYIVSGVSFTSHLSARSGDSAATACRLDIAENRLADELGHVNDPFTTSPSIAFKDAAQIDTIAGGGFNGGTGDMTRIGGPALPDCFFDWGDAPASYGTVTANNGPRHLITSASPYLGASFPDFEVNGSASPAAADDVNGDDEDGVSIPILERGTTIPIQVQVGNVSGATRLQGWIDWNGDGTFAQAGEQVIIDAPVVAGMNTFNINVPQLATIGTSYARFRIANQSGLGTGGIASSGEVEDYVVSIQDARSLQACAASFDVVVFLDNSGSISNAEFDAAQSAIVGIASSVLATPGNRLSVVNFGCRQTSVFPNPRDFNGCRIDLATGSAVPGGWSTNPTDFAYTGTNSSANKVCRSFGNLGGTNDACGGSAFTVLTDEDYAQQALKLLDGALYSGGGTGGTDAYGAGTVAPTAPIQPVIIIHLTDATGLPNNSRFKEVPLADAALGNYYYSNYLKNVRGATILGVGVDLTATTASARAELGALASKGGSSPDYDPAHQTAPSTQPADVGAPRTASFSATFNSGAIVTAFNDVFSTLTQPCVYLQKNWAKAEVGDTASLTATGVLNPPTLSSTANTTNESDLGTTVRVPAGSTLTLGETLGVGNAGRYAASAWSCTGGGSLSGNTLSVTTADNRKTIACAITNTGQHADLAITKVSSPNPYVPGAPLTYTIVASNLGPDAATGATVVDILPAPIAGFSWSCTASPGAQCAAPNGIGSINTSVNVPSGGSVTFTVSGMMPSSPVGALTNTATITPPPDVRDPVLINNTDDDVNPAGAQADLRVSKASSPNPFVPGETLTYTIVASNAGPSDALGARVLDAIPAAFASFTWTCVAAPGAACVTTSGAGDIDAFVDLPAGTTATFTVTGTVPSSYTGSATNTARINPPPTVIDPVPGNNETTTPNPPGPVADLKITKAQTPDPYTPGASLTYTLLVQNLGPSDVTNARVQDVPPGVLTGVTWTCATSSTGASCGTLGGVNIVDALVTLPSGASATFTMVGTVLPSATGVLINTATVTPPPTVTDPVPGNNESTVTSGPAPVADLTITKSASPNPYIPGAPLTFTILVRNQGPSNVLNARVQDLFPAVLSGFSWTCAPSSGTAACGTATGATLIDTFVDLAAGGAVTFTVNGTVPPDATGSLTNTATVTPPPDVRDPDPSNNESAVTLGPGPTANLRVSKTSTPNPYVPGSPIIYTLTYVNDGPSDVVGAHVQDQMPPVLTNIAWTCTAVGGTCAAASGTGNIDGLIDITAGGTVTFTITADVPAGTTGPLVNAATIVPPPNVIDPTPTDNAGIDSNPVRAPGGPADLQITQEFPGVAPPNGLLTFRLVTRNLGSNDALNPYITGMIPPGTTFVSANPGAGGTCTMPGNPPAADPSTGYPIGGAAVAPLKCTWPGLMKPDEQHVLEFTVRVAPGTPTGQILWSCFWTWSETEDPYHANNVIDSYLFTHDGTSPNGDLSLQGAAMSLGVVGPDGGARDGTIGTELAVPMGGTVKIRFWSTNAGPNATRGQYALILDTTNGLEVVDATVPQGWLSPSGPSSAVWDTGHVQPGQTVNVDLTVRVHTTGALKLFAQRVTGAPGDPNAGNERATIVLDGYGPNASGRWVAVGNVDGASGGEIITGTGQGETPQVRVFTGAGADMGVRFFAYERPFLGGVRVASCDVNGDGVNEIITAPGPGRAPSIRVLSVVGGVVTELTAFDAFEPSFAGGVYVSCADLDGDGTAEIIVGAGPGRAPEVQVYNAGVGSLTLRTTFLAYENSFQGGVRVAAGAYPGRAGWINGFGIATMPGPGRAAELRVWEVDGAPVAGAVVSAAGHGAVPVLGDANGDGQLDLIVTPDDGKPELVRIIDIDSGNLVLGVPGNLPGFANGIRPATGILNGGTSELVIGNAAGGDPRVRVISWTPTGPTLRLEVVALEIP